MAENHSPRKEGVKIFLISPRKIYVVDLSEALLMSTTTYVFVNK